MLLNPFSLPKLFQKFFQKKTKTTKKQKKPNMMDEFGHSVMASEVYVEVVYLQISVERKKQ